MMELQTGRPGEEEKKSNERGDRYLLGPAECHDGCDAHLARKEL